MRHHILGLTISVLLAATPAFAAQKPKGSQPKPHAISKSVAKPQASGRPSVKVQGKSTVKAVKVTASGKVHAKSTAPAAKTTTVKTSKKTTTTYASVSGTNTTLTPVQQKLQRNTNLAAKLRSRLPAGTDLMTASAGFRNLGQFVSAVNASYNHNLAFDGLKQRIIYDGMSLGQAMQDMRYADTTVRRR
jgi:hypothetical protein